MERQDVCRFAPSATGRAHPGTLVAALLNWLDARSRDAHCVLRLEDLDPQRCRPELTDALVADLAWFGLEWDLIERQSHNHERHLEGLGELIAGGHVYVCDCSRRQIREAAIPALDGGWVYPGTCRHRTISALKDLPEPGQACLRLRLQPGQERPPFEGIHDPAQDPAKALGDPIIWRRDGAAAYHLASVVDDAAVGVTRIVRGVDLLPSTALQVRIATSLGFSVPAYRHHPLMLETQAQKFAKFHQAIAVPALRQHYDAPSLCGFLAKVLGLRDTDEPVAPEDLVEHFSWDRVVNADQLLVVSDGRLRQGELS